MNRRKAVLFGLLAVGTGYAVRKIWSLMDISDRVSFILSSLKVHNLAIPKNILDVKGYRAVVQVGIRIYNNSGYKVSLQIPQVKAMYSDRVVALSVPDGSVTEVLPNTTNEKSILLDVPLQELAKTGIANDILTSKEKLSEVIARNLTFTIVSKVNGITTTSTHSLSGTGLELSAGPRSVKDGSAFNRYFSKPDNKTIRLMKDGEVEDVVNLAIQIVRDHHQEAKGIARVLKGNTIKETASNIFNFAYRYLQYRRDKPGVEQLRTPARSWYDGQVRHKQMGIDSAGIDCDCYSIFCASILHCLGIPFKFRVTKYYGREYYQHIYVVIPASDKNPEIIIDPVLDIFNYEKPYSEQKDDFSMASLYAVEGLNGMPVDMLNGLDDVDIEDVINGRTFLSGLDGLDDIPDQELLDKTYTYLIQTRNAIMARPEVIKGYTQDVNSLVNMLNDAIKYWHTPMRDQVLERLEKYEEVLEKSGVFKVGMSGVDGSLEGGFFKKIGKLVKKVGKAIVKAPKAIIKAAGKIAKPLVAPVLTAIVASNPLTMALAPAAGKLTSALVNSSKKPAAVKPAPKPVPQPVMVTKSATQPKPTIVSRPVPVEPVVRSTPVTPVIPVTSFAPAKPIVTTMQTQSPMSTTVQKTTQPGFLVRHKKKLLIGGGLLLVGTAAYMLLKPGKQTQTLPQGKAAPKALAGPPASRKKKSRKASKPVKRCIRRKTTKGKTRRRVKRVTLR